MRLSKNPNTTIMILAQGTSYRLMTSREELMAHSTAKGRSFTICLVFENSKERLPWYHYQSKQNNAEVEALHF